jgi:hypothetical protein
MLRASEEAMAEMHNILDQFVKPMENSSALGTLAWTNISDVSAASWESQYLGLREATHVTVGGMTSQ